MEYEHISKLDFENNIGNRVYGIFLARDVDVRLQKDGKTKYLSLNMCDKSFVIGAKKFGATDSEIETLKNGGVYCAAIDIKPYAKSVTGYSCTLYNFNVFNEDPSKFVGWADGMEEAQKVIQDTLNIISNSIYKNLVYNVLINNWTEFCTCAAATGHHHNLLGGLVVHTAEVIQQSMIIADYWNNKYGQGFINIPLLVSGALLHDVGKVKEISTDKTSGVIEYTTEAALESHITMCVSMIDVEAYKLQFGYQTYITDENGNQIPQKPDITLNQEKEALALLKHLVLSHHGKKEYGSPMDMNTPEAYILNKADDLSATMYDYNRKFRTMEKATSNVSWSTNGMIVAYKDSTKA